MKKYEKIISVENFRNQIKNNITAIETLDNKYHILYTDSVQYENCGYITIYYNGDLISALYDSVDVLNARLRGIRQALSIMINK